MADAVAQYKRLRETWDSLGADKIRLETRVEGLRRQEDEQRAELFGLLKVDSMEAAKTALADLRAEVAQSVEQYEALLDGYQEAVAE